MENVEPRKNFLKFFDSLAKAEIQIIGAWLIRLHCDILFTRMQQMNL